MGSQTRDLVSSLFIYLQQTLTEGAGTTLTSSAISVNPAPIIELALIHRSWCDLHKMGVDQRENARGS